MGVMSLGKPRLSRPADLRLWSSGSAVTSCIMSPTVHHCPCVQDSPSPGLDTSGGGVLRRGPFPLFVMDISQSDAADCLLRELDMLKDDALEAADDAIRAPDPALADLCNADG